MATTAEILNEARDKVSYALTMIDVSHHEIHSGDHFYMDGYTSLDIDGVLRVGLVTPNTTKWVHLTWTIYSNGVLTAEFFEGASLSGGTPMTPLNNNRNSSNTSGITLTSGVTSSADGTLISKSKWGGTGFKSVSGGSGSRSDELILKQNTTYLRKFTSHTDSNIIGFKAMWYEHTAKQI